MSDDKNIIDQLYQKQAVEQPPAHLDQLILGKAKTSSAPTRKQFRSPGPWLAAASVVLTLPLIWLLTQQPQLTQQESMAEPAATATEPELTSTTVEVIDAPMEEQEMRRSRQILAKPKAITSDFNTLREQIAPPVAMELEAPTPIAELSTADVPPIDSMQEQDDLEASILVTGSRIQQDSLERNQQLLKQELKTSKKTLKPSNLNPALALELQKFQQYLNQAEWFKAETLLKEMREREPDFDYQDLIDELADRRTDQG